MSKSRIIIVGKGGSGKDYLKQKFIDKGFRSCLSTTTRPSREGEVHMIDYNFIPVYDFDYSIEKGFFQEYDCFNGWYYGTSVYEWNNRDVFIKTPRGVSKISPEDRKNCFIIYLDIDEQTRISRLHKRQDADSVKRRLRSDYNDFKYFTDFDLRITNPNF